MPLPVEQMSPHMLFSWWNLRWLLIILMDSTLLEKKKRINFNTFALKQQNEQTNKKRKFCLCHLYIVFSHTFVVTSLRRFVLTRLPNAWFPLYLWD